MSRRRVAGDNAIHPKHNPFTGVPLENPGRKWPSGSLLEVLAGEIDDYLHSLFKAGE
jgi:hypothetical protein